MFSWKPVKYGDVEYPTWAHILGFIMSMASMLWIPGYAIYYLATETGSFQEVKHYADCEKFHFCSRMQLSSSYT